MAYLTKYTLINLHFINQLGVSAAVLEPLSINLTLTYGASHPINPLYLVASCFAQIESSIYLQPQAM